MRETLAFLFLACACGAATWKGRASEAQRLEAGAREPLDGLPSRAAPTERTARPAGGPLAVGGEAPEKNTAEEHGFGSLEAQAPFLARGMRQSAEEESGGEAVELVRAEDRDTCVRVAFEATRPVTVQLLDAAGGVLAESPAARAGALGERGPVCIRKGDAVHAVADGAGAHVKWIAWTSP